MLGFDKALAEKMFKNILQVQQPVVLELQLNELGRSRLVATRDLVVSQPELVVGHRVQRVQSEKARDKEEKAELKMLERDGRHPGVLLYAVWATRAAKHQGWL